MKPAADRRAGLTLLALSVVFLLLTFLAAFTIFGDIAALLAVVCAAAGAVLLSRASQP